MSVAQALPIPRDPVGRRYVDAIRGAWALGLRHSPECYAKGEWASRNLIYRLLGWRDLSIDGCPWCDFIKKETGTQ